MTVGRNALLCLIALVAAGDTIQTASATLYCNRPYAELTQNPGRPLNAVGYINNGCTAFLIDANHIAAAAHCFADAATGAWFPDLRFYPNFHPQRVAADERHVPRADVIRAVVGSRVDKDMGPGMDWGIARVANWQDSASLDLTPLQLYSGTPSVGIALTNPAYMRHHFPYNDNDTVTWDNMAWDKTRCAKAGESAPGKNDGGMWAFTVRTAPIYTGATRDRVGCNSRWGAGTINANCSLKSLSGGVAIHNCNLIGGSSGSPILYQAANGGWSVVGLNHGGGNDKIDYAANHFELAVPACAGDISKNWDNGGPSVERFLHAPRFAENVAVHRRPDKATATAVFAVDSDLNCVVYRARKATTATYDGEFDYWQDLGGPPMRRGAKLTQIAACAADSNSKPQIFVVLSESQIFTRFVLPNGSWSTWSDFGTPGGGSVADIDASTDANGRCQLFAVAKNGFAYARSKISDTAWSASWGNVAPGSYTRISALNVDGVPWVAVLDTAGDISRISANGGIWIPPMKLNRPPGIAAWRDIDFTWDEAGRGFLVALPTTASNKLWFVPMYGSKAWVEWHFFETHLWAPNAKNAVGVVVPQSAPNLMSVTASRWMEDAGGTTSPVVFGTDDQGNIYFIEYARAGTARWVLDWKSFYHEKIVY